MVIFAEFISFLFHPAILTLLIPLIIVYQQTTDVYSAVRWMIFSSFFLILALIILYIARPKHFFSDFDITKREKRFLFYTISFCIAGLYFLIAVLYKGIYFPLSIVSLGIILSIIMIEILNTFMKVSIHAAVVSAFVVTLGLLYGLMTFYLFIWIAPLVCWSRFILHKHTRNELFAGVILGEVVTLATFTIAKLLL